MVHHTVRLSKYLLNSKYKDVCERALWRLKKLTGPSGTALMTLIDLPNLHPTQVIDPEFKGGPVIALAPRSLSIRLPGMSRRRVRPTGRIGAAKAFWDKCWLYEETKGYVGDAGDHTMPVSPNWHPKCWIRVRDMENLPPWLLYKIFIRPEGFNGHLMKYLGEYEVRAPREDEMERLFWQQTALTEWKPFVTYQLSQVKQGLDGWEILKRCPRGESFQVDISGWPLKYVNPEYLIWYACDQRMDQPIRFPGFVKPSPDPRTWKPVVSKGSWERHHVLSWRHDDDPTCPPEKRRLIPREVAATIWNDNFCPREEGLLPKVKEFLSYPENSHLFRYGYSTSNRGMWDFETDYRKPWREDYPTGKWRGKFDMCLTAFEPGGMYEEHFKRYLAARRKYQAGEIPEAIDEYNRFLADLCQEPFTGPMVERYEALGTNKWHKWLWQGRTPFSGKDGEERDEYDDLELRDDAIPWTPAPRDQWPQDPLLRQAPDTEEEVIEECVKISEWAQGRIRYWERDLSKMGELSRKDTFRQSWEHEDSLTALRLRRQDLEDRVIPMAITFGTDARWIGDALADLHTLEQLLNGERREEEVTEEEEPLPSLVTEEHVTEDGEVKDDIGKAKKADRLTQAWVRSLRSSIGPRKDLAAELELDHILR